jgi:hypothetical protein
MSPDGDFFVFSSFATNFPGDTDGFEDVFLIQFEELNSQNANAPKRVSVPITPPSNGASTWPSIGPFGRFVAFQTNATNFFPVDSNGLAPDIVVTNPFTISENWRFSVSSTDIQGNAGSLVPDIKDPNPNGLTATERNLVVVHESFATNLIDGFADTNVRDVFQTISRTFIRGDANNDGCVNNLDADFLLRYLFIQGPPPPCMDGADANDTGALDIADPTFILIAINNGTPLQPPFGNCGLDSTVDPLSCSVNSQDTTGCFGGFCVP